jgi:transcriptional regulator with XRE-family HTH domain
MVHRGQDGPPDWATRLRKLRRLADLTQVEVADRLGVSQPAIAGWERGKSQPRPEHYSSMMDLYVRCVPLTLVGLPGELAALEKGVPRKERRFTPEWAAQLAKARERLRDSRVRERLRAIKRLRDSTTGQYTKRGEQPRPVTGRPAGRRAE